MNAGAGAGQLNDVTGADPVSDGQNLVLLKARDDPPLAFSFTGRLCLDSNRVTVGEAIGRAIHQRLTTGEAVLDDHLVLSGRPQDHRALLDLVLADEEDDGAPAP